MEKKKHVNPKDFLHKVYTLEGGVENHDSNEQAKGILLLGAIVVVINGLGYLVDKISRKIENQPIKALQKQKDEEPPC